MWHNIMKRKKFIAEWEELITKWKEHIIEWKEHIIKWKERITEWKEHIIEWKERITKWNDHITELKERITKKAAVERIWFAHKAVTGFHRQRIMKFWFIPVVCAFSRNTGNQFKNFGWYRYRYARQFTQNSSFNKRVSDLSYVWK